MSPTRNPSITFTAQRSAEVLDQPLDDAPLRAGEVRGRALVSVVSVGTELAMYRGLFGSFPSQPGYAVVMELTDTGEGVDDLAPGDRVFCMGRHRLWHRLPRRDVVPVPDGLAPETAVFCRLMGVSMTTLVTTPARPPATVLVTGLGIVGNLAAQTFSAAGYTVAAWDPDARRREIARRCDIRGVLDAPPSESPELAGAIALVVECSGHEQAVLESAKLVRKGGEVALVGVPWERRSDAPAFDLLHTIFHRYVAVRSGWEWELPRHAQDFAPGTIFGNFAGAMGLLAEGRVRVDGLATTYSPLDAPTVYERLCEGEMETLTAGFNWTALAI